jgi:hypothetical protein
MKIRSVNLFCLFAITLLASSCVTSFNQNIKDSGIQTDMTKAAHDLEQVEEAQAYAGKIAVSDMDFVANRGQFNVNYNEDTSNYVQAARVNISGDARSSVQTAFFLSSMLQASVTPPVLAGSPGSNNPLPQATIPNQAQTAVNGFSAPPALTGLNPTADERDASEKGINDKLAEDFLRFMANPPIDSNKEAIVFGVMQATCEPGEKTKKGFIAEMNISLRYARHRAIKIYSTNWNENLNPGTNDVVYNLDTHHFITNNLPLSTDTITDVERKDSRTFQSNTLHLVGTNQYVEVLQPTPRPSVLAVLPLMDSRNMELQNNNQSQIEIAAALSAAFAAKGLNAAANILSDYVKRQQDNIQTFNSLPVATAYADGSDFGFQLYPAAEAIENPGKSSSAANVLEPVTFPIVVVLKVSKDEMKTDTGAPWNFLVTEEQPHWIPIKWGNWHKFWLYTKTYLEYPVTSWYGTYGFDFLIYQPNYDLMYRAEKLDEAKICLDNIDAAGMEYPQTIPPLYYHRYHQLEVAFDSLNYSAISTETGRELPDIKELFPPDKSDPNAPSIVDVFPHTIWRDTNTDMLILLKGTTNTDEVSKVTIAGVTCPYTSLHDYASFKYTTNSDKIITTNYAQLGIAMIATLPKYTFYSVTNSATNNVDFAVLFKDLPPATKTVGMLLQGRSLPQANVNLTRDANGRLLGVNIQPGSDLTGTNLLNLVNNVLQKSEPPPKTVNIVK